VLETVGGEQPPPPPHYTRRTVFVFVDSFDLATLAALRYARSLRPTSIRAVHFVIDSVRADRLREKWTRADRGVALDFIDCPDRRLTKAAADLVEREIEDPGTHVTVILPRRTYSPLLGRLLHDRTADKIAVVVSRFPRSAATIVPYDVPSRVTVLQGRQAAKKAEAASAAKAAKAAKAGKPAHVADLPTGVVPEPQESTQAIARHLAAEADIATAHLPADAVEIRPVEQNSVLACEIADSTGQLTALFYGRSHIAGLDPGARVRLRGSVGTRDGHATMINPAYELLAPGPPGPSGT